MKLIPIAGPWPLCTNTFLLVTAAGHAVAIDPAADPAEYKSAAAEHGATITHVFLTHGHYDHVGAVRALRAAGAKVCGDAADALGTRLHPLTPADLDEAWPASGELAVDELRFRIWRTPGHSAGSVVIACEGRLFSGDTLFAGSCGRIDRAGGDPAAMRRSLSLVANLPLPDSTIVLPGHGEATTLGQERRSNPYLLGGL